MEKIIEVVVLIWKNGNQNKKGDINEKILKSIFNWIKGTYYIMLLICGILGINQIALTTEPKDINILIVTISFFAIGYSVKNLIKIAKEVYNETI